MPSKVGFILRVVLTILPLIFCNLVENFNEPICGFPAYFALYSFIRGKVFRLVIIMPMLSHVDLDFTFPFLDVIFDPNLLKSGYLLRVCIVYVNSLHSHQRATCDLVSF